MQSIMNTHFFNVIFNSNIHLNELHNEDTHKAIEYINKTHRRTQKYTNNVSSKVYKVFTRETKEYLHTKNIRFIMEEYYAIS